MYPLSNGNPILLALRQGNRFEVATAIPHQSQNSLKGPMETQRRENGLQRHANGSFSTEPHRESSKQHTPSYDPTRKIQEIAPIATYATQAVTAQVEPSSSTNTPQRHHAGPVKLDNPTSPVATSQTPQRQLTTRPHPSSISPQQPSQPTPEPLVTTPDTPRNKQQEDPVRSKSFNNADLHPKPAHDASPNNLAAVPPNSSPVLEPQPQKHQEKIAVPESSIETRETLSTLAALAEVKSPSGRSKVRKWIQAQRGVSPFPIPEYGQELRAPIASDTNSRPILEPSNVLRVANSPLPVVSNSEAQNSRANAASTEGVDLKSDTESYVMVYTCDACQKPVMDQDTVQCDSCGSVQYCSHPCKRGQRLFHMPRCVGGNQPHASPLLGSIGEEPLTSSEADLSANLPNFDDEFPCFTCEGIKEHQLGCFIIGKLTWILIYDSAQRRAHKLVAFNHDCRPSPFISWSYNHTSPRILILCVEFRDGPRPKYDHTLLSELADKVKYFDPERWREHQNPVEPELEPFSEALAKSNEIIRREASYLNDPFLHVVPDRLLPLMWALRTSPRIQFQFMNEWVIILMYY